MAEEIEKYNDKSQKQGNKFGVAHNSSANIEGKKIEFWIDIGSAGAVLIKNLLKSLAKFPEVEEVIIDL